MDPMIASLLRPEAYDHPVGQVELIETHISWVLLAGAYAYKLKKPVNLGFVDFSTAERRRRCCREELRLNQRLAPELYLDLPVVHGPPERASFIGEGPPIELAVRMHRFPQENLLPEVLARGGLTPSLVVGLADRLAAFHTAAAVAPGGESWGTPEAVRAPALANLEVLRRAGAVASAGGDAPEALAELERWTRAEGERLGPWFAARKEAGVIRECHGDLHLGNLVLRQGRIEVFDCLEFNPALRWIDPISDIAFLAMDLEQRGEAVAARRLLHRWLEGTGDHSGLAAWRWYRVYRALVRAKVMVLRLEQGVADVPERRDLESRLGAAIAWARAVTRPVAAPLVITHGVSGSGKTHAAGFLAGRLGWLHLRSDVERRRLFGRWGARPRTVLTGDPYRAEVGERLYGDLLPACAAAALEAGLPVVVDATFLKQGQRSTFVGLARRCGVPFLILDCRCTPGRALERLERRWREGGDPSEATGAVLARQLREEQPLTPEELRWTLALEPPAEGQEEGPWLEMLVSAVRERLGEEGLG